MSYFGKIYKLAPYRESSFFWRLEVGRNAILTSFHRKNMIAFFLYYLGVADNLGKTDLSCYWLDGEIGRIWNCTDDIFWKFIQDGGPRKWGKCVLCVVYVLFNIFYILFNIFYVLYFIFYILFCILYYILYILLYILYIRGLI